MFKDRVLSTYFTYKFEFNMFISIMHRVTGILLYFLILFAFIYGCTQSLYNSGFTYILYNVFIFNIFMISDNFNMIILLFSIFLFYHLMTGIRHYIWEEKLMLGKTISQSINVIIISTFGVVSLLLLYLLY